MVTQLVWWIVHNGLSLPVYFRVNNIFLIPQDPSVIYTHSAKVMFLSFNYPIFHIFFDKAPLN